MSTAMLRNLSSGMRSRSSSTRGDGPDDEEAAMWAALERLPTYDRIRTTILESLKGSRNELREVDVKDVDHVQYLANQVFKLNNPQEDNEKFLAKLRSRIDRAGVDIPTVEVRYRDLTVTGKVHVGSRALPTLTNTLFDFVDGVLKALKIIPDRKTDLTILNGVSGIIKPGRLTLLLGPPSGGKSTFLTTLAGQADKTLEIEGTILYNGHTFEEFEPRKTAAYITQTDHHSPTLNVRETMDFSARFQGVGSRYDLITELLTKEKEMGIRPDLDTDIFMKASAVEDVSHHIVTEYYIKIMGLDVCANTIVGDQMIKGISGGQRKRLTTGEMIVGPARAFFMDEISTGLDSSTTYQVVKCIGQFASISKQTVCMSLLQPAPETYNLFDDVILLSGGEAVYHGPRDDILDFFEFCGFRCPPRKGVADYLQEVTSLRDQEQYWIDKSAPYSFVSAQDFAERFRKFHVGEKLFQELDVPFDRSTSHKAGLVHKKWSLSAFDLFKITIDRELLLLKKDPVFILLMIMEVVVGGIIASVFFRTNMDHHSLHDAQVYAGALFIVTTQAVFSGYQELAVTTGRYPVFSKFRQMQFFPPWAWSTSLLIIKIPSCILETFFLICCNYYIIGFAPAPARFFRHWLLLAVGDLMSACLFRTVACVCRSIYLGSSVGGFGMLVLFTLGGFVISRNDIRGWWIWGYYISPVSYTMNSVMVNEYFADRWKHHVGGDDHTVGQRYILSKGLFARGYWYWLGLVGVLIAAMILQFCFTMAVTYLGPPEKSRAVVSQELMAEWHANLTGDIDKSVVALPRSISKEFDSGPASARRSKRKSFAGDDNTGGESSDVAPSSESQPLQRDRSKTSGLGFMSLGSRGTSRKLTTKSGRQLSSSSYGDLGEKPGMVLPFQPFSISFKDIGYSVDMPAGQKQQGVTEDKLQLLRGITGAFQPGVLTALVGVTGAGKSTLMDVLSGRKTRGYVEGEIRINGYPKVQETFTRIAGYCEQNDIHSPQITVNESIIFSAWLRLQPEVTPETKMDFAKMVLDLVELTPLRDALVGVPGQTGLSPEQRKRLTIAVELVANPSIIFMDEPTSGLDARAAATVMRAVRNTVDTGRTVVCTIHQPSIDIFETFDELLLLKRGGQAIYAGPLGHNSSVLVDYFQNMADVPKIKEGENPAAWMLEISTPGMEQKLGVDFADLYDKSDAAKQTRELVEKLNIPPPNTEDLSFPTRYAQPLWVQFTCCLWKQFWTYWRSPGYNFMRFFLCVAASSFMGTVFWAFGHKMTTERRLYSLMGSIYCSTAFYGLLTCAGIQPVITAERTVFYRERGAGMYSEISYALAQCLIEVPFVFIASTVYTSLEYSMIKLEWKADKFLLFWFYTFNSQLTFAFWGMMTIALTPNPGVAVLLVTLGNQMWAIFSGFPITRKDMPVWWKWAYWCDPSAYSLYAKIVSQFGDYSHKYVTTTDGSVKSVKHMIEHAYGFKHSYLGFVTSMTALYPLLFAVGFILAITFLNYQQR